MKKHLLISLAIIAFLFGGTILIIFYGRGYRFGFQQGKPEFSQTGLLAVKSNPDGAQVFINNHLTTATNNTINLTPGNYAVKIYKEGYFPYQKSVSIQKEVVTQVNALLFPTAPKLENITITGVYNPVLDPSLTKIAFTASPSADDNHKNGVFIFNMASPLLTLQNSASQTADDTLNKFSQSNLVWSPDGKNLMASISAATQTTNYLLDANSFNQNPSDITETLDTVTSGWQKEKQDKEKAQIGTLKPILAKNVKDNFKIISWSPDEEKILYSASLSAEIPTIINPPLIGVNSTPEDRNIKKDAVYVYDITEDRNYKILDTTPTASDSAFPLSWFPDSGHLISTHDGKIDILDYDGANKTTIYAGAFIDHYVFAWPNGSKIVILTNLGNSSVSPNLYTIGLK